MKNMKKESIPCPNCNIPIPIKNIKAVLFRCNNCNKVVCDKCSIDNNCLDCHILIKYPIIMKAYLEDKYNNVVIA